MKPFTVNPLLLAMLPVHNEAHRYLKTVLDRLNEYVDGIVVIDDASTDETPDICRDHPGVLRYHHIPQPLFCSNEAALRRMLWELTVELEPGWVMAIDADEIMGSGIKREISILTGQSRFDFFFFNTYHFWGNLSSYRVDGLWNPVLSKTPCLYRFQKDLTYHWPNRKLHCGRFPMECYQRPGSVSKIPLLHLGYANESDQLNKFQRYLGLDPEGKFCSITHYHSITSFPSLKQWTGERLLI